MMAGGDSDDEHLAYGDYHPVRHEGERGILANTRKTLMAAVC